MASFGSVMYGPRVHGTPWVISTHEVDISLADRCQRLDDFISIIERKRPAIFIIIALALAFYTPCKVFTVTVIVFGGLNLMYNFVAHL